MSEVKTNYLLEELKATNSLLCGRQKMIHNRLLKHAKAVEVLPMSEVLLPSVIEYIKDYIQPKRHECYKTAQLISQTCPQITYVEGKMGVGGIGIDHAFNCFNGKYFDATAELALGRDVTKESYLSILEINSPTFIIQRQLETGYYTDLLLYCLNKNKFI